jgi:DNA-binding NarL/FixJ family response regulator
VSTFPTTVVVVDDQELVRDGIAALLSAEPDLEVVGTAADGVEAIGLVQSLHPVVVLMDIQMPDIDGIEATRRLCASGTDAKILILTTFGADDNVIAALRAGASGFLLKRARPAEVVEAIRVAARGESLLFPAALRRLVAGRGGGSGDRLRDAGLTDREADVLRRMAAGRSNAEIAAELVVSVETVKTHVGNVLAKLGARDRTQAVIAAYESGFVTPSG